MSSSRTGVRGRRRGRLRPGGAGGGGAAGQVPQAGPRLAVTLAVSGLQGAAVTAYFIVS